MNQPTFNVNNHIPLAEDCIPLGHSIVGGCSLCGGPVCVPTVWHSIVPATPTCARCGATEKRRADYGPVIPMESQQILTAGTK